MNISSDSVQWLSLTLVFFFLFHLWNLPVHRPPAVLLGAGQQDDRGDAEDRNRLPLVQMEDHRTTNRHFPHFTEHAEWVSAPDDCPLTVSS